MSSESQVKDVLGENKEDWPEVAIIVLNWNNYEDTAECLESLEDVEYPNYEVIVVDNGSTDGSLMNLRKYLGNYPSSDTNYEENVEKSHRYSLFDFECASSIDNSSDILLFSSERNRGYSGGNNIGLGYSVANFYDYAVVLNNDAVVDKSFLMEMAFVAEDSGAGVVGGLIKDMSGDEITFSRSKYPNMLFYGVPQNDPPSKKWWGSDRVEGSAMLLTRDLLLERWNDQGYFLDPSLFLYGEEIELGIWCMKNDFEVVVARDAVVYHEVGASSDKLDQFYYLSRNRLLIARKHLGWEKLIFFILFPLWRMIRAGMYALSTQYNVSVCILKGTYHGLIGIEGEENCDNLFH
ncbi:MAG: glycosyltransferase family 2 protein [Candidatus Nanohaloarchaea archaeon]